MTAGLVSRRVFVPALVLFAELGACRGGEPRASVPASAGGVASGRFARAANARRPSELGPKGPRAQLSPWLSREACTSALARGERARRAPERVRIGTWNIRWFPDGRPGKKPAPEGLDVAWLACAIAWLDLDVLVVQEFKAHERARARTAELVRRLDAATGGRWAAELDPCPHPVGQHVGLVFDARRVTASHWQTYESLNPHGDACRDQLRPGFGAYFRFQAGLDLHLVAVHWKSGQKRRDFELRRRSFAGLDAAFAQAQRSVPDADVLFAGDFNSMGCARCSPRISAEAELTRVDSDLSALRTPLRRLADEPACSHYFGVRATLLDFFVAASLDELPASRKATVYGPCADHGCGSLPRAQTRSAFAQRLSDHCPVVVELDASDKD
ncbi:MAG TPA: endonuclease/exonuclease/phosphatase family protein [Polyangiaceae bacterium]